jgi:predicted nucleic acid binding AN1-type Zn finger protein
MSQNTRAPRSQEVDESQNDQSQADAGEKRCATCGDVVDPSDYRVKQCTVCGSWYCYKHLGQYKAQCIPCKTYSLKNCYGR